MFNEYVKQETSSRHITRMRSLISLTEELRFLEHSWNKLMILIIIRRGITVIAILFKVVTGKYSLRTRTYEMSHVEEE